jgi:hypothetical protein
MKKQITEKYSLSNDSSSSSSPNSSSVVDEKLPRKLQAVMDDYLSIDKRHRHSDINVFVEDKSGEIRWSCPCNPHRKGPYEWQGVDKMRRHTSGKVHLEYMKTRKAPKQAKRKPVNEAVLKVKTVEAISRYMSINPENHREDDIKVFYDREKEIFKWSCQCVKHKSGYALQGLQHMKIHTSSGPHTEYVETRVAIEEQDKLMKGFEREFGGKAKSFDLVSWWQGQGLFPHMLEWEYNDNYQEEARCGYCECLVGRTNNEEAFKKHVAGITHQTNVRKLKIDRKETINKPSAPAKSTMRGARPPRSPSKKNVKDDSEKKPIDPTIIEINEDLPRKSIRPNLPIKPKKRERSPSPVVEKDDKERERELKRGLIDRIYKRAYDYVDSKNIEAEIEERSKKMVSKILDEVFE